MNYYDTHVFGRMNSLFKLCFNFLFLLKDLTYRIWSESSKCVRRECKLWGTDMHGSCHYGSLRMLRMKNTRNWQMVHTAGSLLLWILSMVILIIIGQSGGVTTAYQTDEPRNEPRPLKCEKVHSRKPPCWGIVGYTLLRTCACTCNRRLLYWFLVCILSSCAVLLAFNPSAWGHLNPSSYCDVGRLFLRGI
jgi:hypothetical protein